MTKNIVWDDVFESTNNFFGLLLIVLIQNRYDFGTMPAKHSILIKPKRINKHFFHAKIKQYNKISVVKDCWLTTNSGISSLS